MVTWKFRRSQLNAFQRPDFEGGKKKNITVHVMRNPLLKIHFQTLFHEQSDKYSNYIEIENNGQSISV